MKRIAIWLDLSTSYGRKVLEGVHAHSARGNWELLAEAWGDIGVEDLQANEGIDGLIVSVSEPRLAQTLKDVKKPVVDVGGFLPGAPGWASVTPDYQQAGRLAAQHFLERGFLELGFLGVARSWGSKALESGFRQMAGSRQASVRSFHTSLHWRGQRGQERQKLSEFLQTLPRPCALFTADDVLSRRVLQSLRGLGFHVPRDVAVLGMGDYEVVNRITNPPLSSVVIPAREVGYRAAAVLQTMLEHDPTPQSVQIPCISLAVRRSTEALRGDNDPLVAKALALMQEGYQGELDVSTIAQSLSVSRRLLEQRFQRVMGCGPAASLRQVRLERAQQLLRDTDWSLRSVAVACGIPSGDRLCRIFREVLQTTPGQYRACYRNGMPGG